MDINEPKIETEQILRLKKDEHFCPDNVCIVTGAASGIGRATAIAAAANNLLVVGLDINEQQAKKTQEMANQTDGKMRVR